MKTLDQLLDLAESTAKAALLSAKDPSLQPTWIIVDPKDCCHIIHTPWQNDFEKDLAALLLRLELRDRQATAYAVIMECWCAHAPADWTPEQRLEARPRDRLDRREAVLAVACTREGNKARSWSIKRNWLEQITSLEPSDLTGGRFTGWMTELFQ
jgi:hypothetical protein